MAYIKASGSLLLGVLVVLNASITYAQTPNEAASNKKPAALQAAKDNGNPAGAQEGRKEATLNENLKIFQPFLGSWRSLTNSLRKAPLSMTLTADAGGNAVMLSISENAKPDLVKLIWWDPDNKKIDVRTVNSHEEGAQISVIKSGAPGKLSEEFGPATIFWQIIDKDTHEISWSDNFAPKITFRRAR